MIIKLYVFSAKQNNLDCKKPLKNVFKSSCDDYTAHIFIRHTN